MFKSFVVDNNDVSPDTILAILKKDYKKLAERMDFILTGAFQCTNFGKYTIKGDCCIFRRQIRSL